jgi:hypothetical protein
MDQYKGGKGSDRQQYLSLWSAQTLKVDRKGGGSVYVREPVASVVGGIQPDLVGTLHDSARRRDGFVERVLPVVPDVEPARWTDAAPSTEQYRDVLAVFRALDKLAYPSVEDDPGSPRGYGVNLSAEARALFVAWHDENAALVEAAEGLAEGFYSKLPAHVARLALILHALWHPDDPRVMVSADRMRDATELGEFFRVHIGRFLALLRASAPTGSAGLSARIVRILRATAQEASDGWVSRSDLLRRLGNVQADELTASLLALLTAGTAERRMTATATRPSEQWRLAAALGVVSTSKDSKHSNDSPALPTSEPQGPRNFEFFESFEPATAAAEAAMPSAPDDPWAGGEEEVF